MEIKHRVILVDNVYGITSPTLKRLIHEVRICNVSFDVYNVMRFIGRKYLKKKMEEMYDTQEKNYKVLCKKDLDDNNVIVDGTHNYDKINIKCAPFERLMRELTQDIITDYRVDKEGCDIMKKYFIDYLIAIVKVAISRMDDEHKKSLHAKHFKGL